MYRGGLPGQRIAELVGVSASTLNHHLRLARAADPELRPAHEEAVRATPSSVTAAAWNGCRSS
ncbi:DNA-binding transcriptional regulator YdaS (Cro superfamily) [Arthrobacter sp. V4I6]|nr:DNA-binding transcriptional regulator YdaS (Cro superfamily) [Arthrobacter sp. V1I7]MDQ0855019.1 DNA-binding transcriptional regulator YdaS (Cro superfamily) [Arthrobacter sp. V4I6]